MGVCVCCTEIRNGRGYEWLVLAGSSSGLLERDVVMLTAEWTGVERRRSERRDEARSQRRDVETTRSTWQSDRQPRQTTASSPRRTPGKSSTSISLTVSRKFSRRAKTLFFICYSQTR